MSSTPLRVLSLLVAVLLFAVSCAASDEPIAAETAATDDPAETASDPAPNTNSAPATTAPEATSIPVPVDDQAADEAIAGLDDEPSSEETDPAPVDLDPIQTAQGFVRNRFNIDPSTEALDCMVAQAATDPVLETALQEAAVAAGQVDDTSLKALAFAVAGCVDGTSLGDWATEAVGPTGPVRESAPACFADRFEDPDRGDITFYTFAALTYQFRVEPEGVPDVTDAFVTCAPVTGLTEFFASQYEAEQGYTSFIDRDCATEVLADPELSLRFWSALIEGLQPPIETVIEEIVPCAETPEPAADLAAEIPGDFVPWSGTAALSGVNPAVRNGLYAAAPPMSISQTGSYQAVLATGGGEIRIELFADTAPLTVNSFVSLARDGFYDQTVFHRVISGFMAQGGDPSGTGTGGPGYSFADEFTGGRQMDRKGLLAMANSGPATNGSQFFITFDAAPHLTGAHTIFGEVVAGIDVLDAIAPRNPQAPTGPGQLIESITIIEN